MALGHADVIEMMFATPERRSLYDFTPAFATVSVAIYADPAITGLVDPTSLKGFVVGVERGDACVERLRAAGVKTLRQYSSYRDIIDSAFAKEIRIFCMDKYPADYYLYRSGAQSRFVRAFDFYSDDLRRGVHKGDKATLALVNQGMARISPQEREQLREKWMGQTIDLSGYAPALKAISAALAAAGIALLIWVYTLRRAVRRRTRDLEYLAHYDPMTGLANRTLLLDRIDHAIQQGEAALAVLVIDLDNFKRINESLGHPVGDKLLLTVGERLKALPGSIDTVAHLSGDDFVLTLRSTDVGQVVALAEQVQREIARPYTLNGQDVFVSASVGISLYPEDGPDGVALLKNADAATFRAQRNGLNGISFYNASLSTQATDFITLGSSIRRAIEQEEFELLYQPQCCLTSGRIVGVEALVRWRQGATLIAPSEFITYAEEHGLIEALGGWVMRTACLQLAAWLADGASTVRMAVNLSPRQMGCAGLVSSIESALADASLPSHLLELEITEGAVVNQDRATAEVLDALRSLGVGIALDDFGTGYSSLAYLRHLPVTLIKIDKSFLDNLPEENNAKQVVAAIVAMAHALGMRVIAEGVERAAQAEFLKEIGCDFAQGWFYGRPMGPAAIRELLRGVLEGPPPDRPHQGLRGASEA
jgi:diguanylate cyclase (GGDEF)-like protein